MSYESRLKDRSNSFLQPTQIAFIVSVLLHFLIYKFGLPSFGLHFNNSVNREVSIIELTPEQQSRLPDLEPQVDIPELPNTPLDSSTQPFALPPSINPAFGNFPNLPPIDLPPPPNFDISGLPPFPGTDIKLPPIGDLSDLPLPPPLDSLDSNTSTKTPATQPTPPQPPSQPDKPKTPKAQPSQTKQPQTPPKEIIVKRQQTLNKNLRSLSSSLQKREAGTTDEDARKNYVAWLNEIKDIKPEQLKIKGTYPRDACIRRLAGTSIYGVVVDAEGMVVAVDLIKSAQYPLFNEQAIDDIRNRAFKHKSNKPKPYQIEVNYEYDRETCPSLSLPSVLRDKPSPAKPEQPPTDKPSPAKPEQPPTDNQTPAKPEQPPTGNQTPAKPEQPPTDNQTPAKPEQPPTGNQTPAKPEQPPTGNQTPTKPEQPPTDKPSPTKPEQPPTDNQTPTKPEQPSLRDRLENAPLLPNDRLRQIPNDN
jgi:hypothetical protein